MKHIFGVILLAVGLLSGCDLVGKVGASWANEPMTLVFTPGYEVAIDTKPIGLYGFDACPKQDPAMTKLFGPAPTDDSTGCVIVTPKTKSVRVKLALATGPVVEEWAIHRDRQHPDRVHLKRPDGSPVISYAAFSKAKKQQNTAFSAGANS